MSWREERATESDREKFQKVKKCKNCLSNDLLLLYLPSSVLILGR